jgi:hypothetical protein
MVCRHLSESTHWEKPIVNLFSLFEFKQDANNKVEVMNKKKILAGID